MTRYLFVKTIRLRARNHFHYSSETFPPGVGSVQFVAKMKLEQNVHLQHKVDNEYSNLRESFSRFLQ
jgi:hypothetical protein